MLVAVNVVFCCASLFKTKITSLSSITKQFDIDRIRKSLDLRVSL